MIYKTLGFSLLLFFSGLHEGRDRRIRKAKAKEEDTSLFTVCMFNIRI
jgi:hypothetical protein